MANHLLLPPDVTKDQDWRMVPGSRRVGQDPLGELPGPGIEALSAAPARDGCRFGAGRGVDRCRGRLRGDAAYEYRISGNKWAAPGWVLLSECSQEAKSHYLNRQIVAVEIAPLDQEHVIHAHHRTKPDQAEEHYWTRECHASVNTDFTCVAFHSNWYGDDSESAASLFFLELPVDILSWAEQSSPDLPDEIP